VVAEDVRRQVMNQNPQVRAMVEDRIFQSYMEWLKTVYDFYKHLMIIALASIAAMVALLGDVFKPQPLVAVAIVAFLLASVVSLGGMNRARRTILHLHEARTRAHFECLREKHGKIGWLTRKQVWILSTGFYAIGIFAFIIFLATGIF
jgi:hypothetical protein